MSKLTLMTGVNIESEYNYGNARKEKEIEYMYYTLRTTEDFYAFQDIIHFNYAGLSQTQKNIFDKLGGMSTTEFIGYRVESKKCVPYKLDAFSRTDTLLTDTIFYILTNYENASVSVPVRKKTIWTMREDSYQTDSAQEILDALRISHKVDDSLSKKDIETLLNSNYIGIQGSTFTINNKKDESVPIAIAGSFGERWVNDKNGGSNKRTAFINGASMSSKIHAPTTVKKILNKRIKDVLSECMSMKGVDEFHTTALFNAYRKKVDIGRSKFSIEGVPVAELEKMRVSKYEPATDRIKNALTEYTNVKETQGALERYEPKLYHVCKKGDTYEVTSFGRVNFNSFSKNYAKLVGDASNILTYDDIPEDIRGKMAMLDVTSDPRRTNYIYSTHHIFHEVKSSYGAHEDSNAHTQFVEGMGMKITESRWWVFID